MYDLRKTDLARACAVLTEAFSRDPFYSYITGGEGYDHGTARFFHAFTLVYGLRYGRVYASSPDIEGVAIWLPPGETEMSGWRTVAAGAETIRMEGVPRMPRGSGILRRLERYGTYAERIHKRRAPFPHWYLMVLGVADAYRGTGTASRLLRPMLSHCDGLDLPCYLETHNPANPPIYEHFGFGIVEEGRLPGSDKPHWAMLRPAARAKT